MGQGYVPAVPELFYVQTSKWSTEVVRKSYAQDISGSHSHKGISCKIKEQIEAVQPGISGGKVPGGTALAHGLFTYGEQCVELGAQRQLVDQAQRSLKIPSASISR